MENIHEIISFSSELPIRFFFQEIGSIGKHWHTSIEILFILSGEADIIVDDRSFHLLPDDVLLINSNALHELYASSCELALFQMNLTKLPYFEEYGNLYFDCCSAGQKHTEKYVFLGMRVKNNPSVKMHNNTSLEIKNPEQKTQDYFFNFKPLITAR